MLSSWKTTEKVYFIKNNNSNFLHFWEGSAEINLIRKDENLLSLDYTRDFVYGKSESVKHIFRENILVPKMCCIMSDPHWMKIRSETWGIFLCSRFKPNACAISLSDMRVFLLWKGKTLALIFGSKRTRRKIFSHLPKDERKINLIDN